MQRIGAWSEASKNKLADLLFSTDKGIGLSMWRFNIGGGINRDSIRGRWQTVETFEVAQGKYDWTRQASERWFARAAHERGVPYLLGFVNSPPGRMTRNGLTNLADDETSTTNLKPGFEKQYATYLCDILEHFLNALEPERLTFNYVSPVNEPQIDWQGGKQEGNRASNEDIRKIIVALHDEIAARKLDVKIRAPESNTVPGLWQLDENASQRWGAKYGDYLDALLGDPKIARMLDNTLCYHDYSSYEAPDVEADHQILGDKRLNYPDCDLWMSEVCILSRERDLSMEMALQIAKLIHADLVLSGASAWNWWLALSGGDYKDGLLYTDWRAPRDPESIIESKTFWAMGNFSRFIRPGMQRVELKGDQHSFDGLLGSAYVDAKSNKLVLVYINVTNEPQKISWTFKQGDKRAPLPQNFTPYVTSGDQSLQAGPTISSQSAEVPARSVVTFVSNNP